MIRKSSFREKVGSENQMHFPVIIVRFICSTYQIIKLILATPCSLENIWAHFNIELSGTWSWRITSCRQAFQTTFLKTSQGRFQFFSNIKILEKYIFQNYFFSSYNNCIIILVFYCNCNCFNVIVITFIWRHDAPTEVVMWRINIWKRKKREPEICWHETNKYLFHPYLLTVLNISEQSIKLFLSNWFWSRKTVGKPLTCLRRFVLFVPRLNGLKMPK